MLKSAWFIVMVLLLLSGFCGLAGIMLVHLRTQALEQAEANATNLLAALSQDIERTIELYDLSLLAVINGLRLPGQAQLRPDIRHALLFDGAASATYLGAILVLDENGDVREDSTESSPRHGNFADRAYFKAHQANRDLGLYISTPYASRLNRPGEMMVGLSRRLTRSDGSFGGVVVGAMRLDYFKNLLSKLHFGERDGVTLFSIDGVLIMRSPYDKALIGQDFSHSLNIQRFIAELSGRFTSISAIDGVRRIYNFTHVGSFPLILDVSLSEDDVFAAWRTRTTVIGLALFALCGVAASLAALFAREMRRSACAERDAQASKRQLQAANIELERLASIDGLTGLKNRRCFDDAVEREWRRAQRDGSSLSLMMLDVDCFKSFNDQYGHQAGDVCLRAVADAVVVCARRAPDLVARYGGEEIVLLLPATEADGAWTIAERVRAAIEALQLPHDGNRSNGGVVTASIGISTVLLSTAKPDRIVSCEALIAAADQALYEAKRNGRNRVMKCMTDMQKQGALFCKIALNNKSD